MTTGKSLKEQNAWLISAVLVLHALAFAYVVVQPLPLANDSLAELGQKAKHYLAPGSISLALIALTRLILLGLVPAQMRDRLIHWRWRHPLPGSRAFSKIGPADQRVDMQKLATTYGKLPSDPEQQGRLFYSIYKSHASDVGVLDAHKSYLAARDIGTIDFILFVLLAPLAYFFTADHVRWSIYAGALFAAYVLICIAAQVYASRLVQNSLAVASHTTVTKTRRKGNSA